MLVSIEPLKSNAGVMASAAPLQLNPGAHLIHVATYEGDSLPGNAELQRQGAQAIEAATFAPGYVTSLTSSSRVYISHESIGTGSQSQSLSASLGRSHRRGPVTPREEDSLLEETPKVDANGGWYTATLKCICSCALYAGPLRCFSPMAKPPTVRSSLTELDKVGAAPLVGALLKNWHDPPSPPSLDEPELLDFKVVWNVPAFTTGPSATNLAQMILARRASHQSASESWKGKGRLVEDEGSADPSQEADEDGQSTRGAGFKRVSPVAAEEEEEEVQLGRKKRKRDRRRQLEGDAMSGKILELLLPHTHPPPPPHAVVYLDIQQSKTPDYSQAVPRGIRRLVIAYPHMRVHWIIPVHGSIILPGSTLYPTAATFSMRRPSKTAKPTNPTWTPHRLAQFWRDILQGKLQKSGFYGPIGLAASGPKPEPHLVSGVDERVICGDHIRIYCDLQWALKVRKFLEYVRISDKELADDMKGLKGERLLKNALLVLVGDTGEPLMVA